MKIRTAVLIFFLPIGPLLADPVIENVQQALKDECFYYGEVTGNKDADTTAAIRRYQIRNGLQITGDLNDETLKALGVNSSGGRAVVRADLRITDRTASPRLAGDSIWPARANFCADGFRLVVGGGSCFAGSAF